MNKDEMMECVKRQRIIEEEIITAIERLNKTFYGKYYIELHSLEVVVKPGIKPKEDE